MHGNADSERGAIVLGWLSRVVIVLVVVAIALFDTIAIASARFSITDDANAAAEAANAAWNQSNGNVQLAYNAAADYADSHGDTIAPKSFSITTAGAVRLTLQGRATTLVVSHVGPLKKLAKTSAVGTATTPAN
jgi:hypothetical protein